MSETIRVVLESIVDGVWVLDRAGNTVYANGASAALLQVERQDLARLNLQNYLSQLVTQSGGTLRAGVRLQRDVAVIAGESLQWIRLTVIPRFSADGLRDGYIVMLADARMFADRRAPIYDSGVAQSIFTPLNERQQLLLRKLSPKQRLVAEELLSGNRVPAIAKRLSVTPSTVRNQLSVAYRKLGVSSQQGLIDLFRAPLPD